MEKFLKNTSSVYHSSEDITKLIEAYADPELKGSMEHENVQKLLIDLATNIIYSKIAKKIKTSEMEDYRSQAKLEAYEALLSYDSSKGSFTNYLYSKSDWFNTEATTEKVSKLTIIGASQRKVLQAYKSASSQKYDNVTKEDVLEQSISYHLNKNSELTREEAINILKKNGEYKIIMKDLNHIIQIGDVGFDLNVQRDEDTFENSKVPTVNNINEDMYVDPLEGTLEKILLMVGGNDITQAIVSGYYGVLQKVVGTFSLRDDLTEGIDLNKPLGYTALSAITNTPKEKVKKIIKDSTSKVRSPHAHWVYLSENSYITETSNSSYKDKLQEIKPLLLSI